MVPALLLLCFVQLIHAQQGFQLAPPLLDYPGSFIRDSVQVSIRFNQPGAAVHYCFEDRDPQASDPVYKGPITMKQAGILSIRALGENFLPSETSHLVFYEAGREIDSLRTSPMNEYYSQRPARLLNDARGGIANYRTEGWLGFDSDSVWIEASWNKTQSIRGIGINMLRDQQSWIFLPRTIEIWAADEASGEWKLVQERKLSSEQEAPKQLHLASFQFDKAIQSKAIRIRMLNVSKLPEWHAGRGQRGWLFVDELIIR
jgi:hypothetical protein